MANEIGIYCPSYKRPIGISTQKYFSSAKYVVCESQAESYKKQGHKLWVVPDSAQGNLCRIRNYILDNAPERKILLLDDDLDCIGIWWGRKHHRLDGEKALEYIESWFNLADEMGSKFLGLNCIQDKGSYREYTPFSFSIYIGGPFQGFIDNPLRYDENLPLKEDYDMTLQVLNKYRKVLRINYAHYFARQHSNKGGCASYRTIQREKEQFELLERKWGNKIVQRDSGKSSVTRKAEVVYDINPVIRIPIKGI